MPDRVASCRCGKLVIRTRGEPLRVSICHCLACQQRTGSVFGAQARFPAQAVTIDRQGKEYVRVGDSGEAIHYHFCPECGSTVFYVQAGAPAIIAIPVGAFADPDFPKPVISFYEARKHHWVVLSPGIEHLD